MDDTSWLWCADSSRSATGRLRLLAFDDVSPELLDGFLLNVSQRSTVQRMSSTLVILSRSPWQLFACVAVLFRHKKHLVKVWIRLCFGPNKHGKRSVVCCYRSRGQQGNNQWGHICKRCTVVCHQKYPDATFETQSWTVVTGLAAFTLGLGIIR